MPSGKIQITANTARELDMLTDYVKALMGEAIDLDAPRLYRAGQHHAFGYLTLETATLELPPRAVGDE